MPIIELSKIKKIFSYGKPNQFDALDGISMNVEKGEFVAIMGVSGSGKSTLMNIIGCLDKPTSGQYKLDGLDIGSLQHRELVKIRRNKVGFIFQNFNLLPRRSALSNVELPLIYQGIKPAIRHQRARQVLAEVGLAEKTSYKPSMLSGGEQQRVAIARALINSSEIILADEPTGNLDSKSGQAVMEVLKRLNRTGKTIIIVTHDPSIAQLAQRIVKIVDGKIS